ncbi:MAG TPA: serine/threonine-protein kinase [Polyangiaceae bacterium]|nr:serine/threonine-protein kinase [Polyangiaceae bacterium]
MLSTGEIIDGKYRTIRLIGEGGMGAVYEAENIRIHRKVAIKVLHAGVAETAEAVQRFEREAQAAGRIGSEHIVEVLDLGNLPSGDRYMVMEFMDGDSLGGRIKSKGRLSPAELFPIAHQLLAALDAAHNAGIIHRDLKPDNVYLLRSRSGVADFVKLLDFGISKFNQLSGDSGFSMTRTGAVMGTPYYMAPEQAKGAKDADHRVDLYAAGVILYESVTGEVPFNADTFNELLFKIVLEEPRPVQQLVPQIDLGFAAIINKAMTRDPAARFQTAKEFQLALEHWVANAGPELAQALRAPAAGRASIADGTGQFARQPGVGPLLSTGTPGTWANTGGVTAQMPAPIKHSNAGLFVVLGVVGLLVIGGGVLGMRVLSKSSEAAPVAAAAVPNAAEEKLKTEALLATAKAQQQEADAKAEAERNAEAAKQAAAQAAASAAATASATPAPSVPAAAAKQKVSVRAIARPAAVTPNPAPKAAPTPAPTPTSTGRKIRTSL